MKTSKKRFLYTCIQMIAVFVMLFAGYQLYKAYQQDKQNAQTKETAITTANVQDSHDNIDFQTLQAMNEDIIGWIYIPDTAIDYPILQGDDNAYYLNHNYVKEEAIIGSIFMDANNQADFQDAHTILYGHNVPEGDMFKDLEKYKEEAFYKAHPVVYLYTPSQNYELEIISFYQAKEDSDAYQYFYTHEEAFLQYVKNQLALSIYDTGISMQQEDSIVTLSTCSYESGKGINTDLRYILQTKLTIKE